MAGRMFTLEEAAEIAEVSPGTLNMQFARGVFAVGTEDKAAPRRGVPRLLSANTVLAIAIANALRRVGISLDRAARAGDMFAHTNMGLPRRPGPGQLFDRGDQTFM